MKNEKLYDAISDIREEFIEEAENYKFKNFCEKINRYRDWSRTMSAGDLLRRICDDCAFFDIALNFRSGERSKSNILSFISVVQ